jgi:hypothetical protein
MDDIVRDIVNLTKDEDAITPDKMRMVNYIPMVGKAWYWWFGGGRDISDKKLEEEQ